MRAQFGQQLAHVDAAAVIILTMLIEEAMNEAQCGNPRARLTKHLTRGRIGDAVCLKRQQAGHDLEIVLDAVMNLSG